MKHSFYYAELDLTVELVDGKDDILSTFSQWDVQVLSLMFHSIITDFLMVRTIYAADAAEYAKRLEVATKRDNEYKGED